MIQPQQFPEVRSRIEMAGVDREIWICTFQKTIHKAARIFFSLAILVRPSLRTVSCYSYPHVFA
jgi:hypothetical protein